MSPAIIGVAFAILPGSISYGSIQGQDDSLRRHEARAPLVDKDSGNHKTGGAEGTNPYSMVGWSVLVLGLLGAFLIGLRKWVSRSSVPGSAEGMIEILARRRLSGSQELLVIQVAGRILVLASTSGGGVSVVSEITDRAQIAEMRAQTAIAPKRKAVEIN